MRLQKVLKNIKLEEGFEYSIHSYSGRNMYGKSCLAITGNDINLFNLGFLIREYGENETYENIFCNKIDNMGLGIVVYWPYIEFIEENSEEEEED
jgi:hypothetical protein